MTITIYVPKDLWEEIKRDDRLKISRTCQRALRRELKELKRRDSNKEKQT